ncbi:DUF6572 domain-containing protein [Streptococcus oralis]|uniref:DUF6572 domain-containing protein n=1 Tax=Streptococcus oralis TaxID=1303 RepID=UPI000F664D16|nr:DUF6572 domain-containing protein [Streptococcus oralis]RSK20140.1 hypothetical protein D8846_02400 [Streptococcus oralis]
MTKQELVNFINKHRDKIGIFHIALDERFEGQFTLGYYYNEKSKQYKVYEVNERQDIWIRDEFKNESDAIDRLYRLIKTTFWIKESLIQLDVSEIDAIGTSDTDLELLLIDGNLWLPDTEKEHLLKLQEKLNNYIYFLESKQYVDRYGDSFDKKVIHITFQYSPSDNGLAFLAAVQKVLQPTDMILKVELPE